MKVIEGKSLKDTIYVDEVGLYINISYIKVWFLNMNILGRGEIGIVKTDWIITNYASSEYG